MQNNTKHNGLVYALLLASIGFANAGCERLDRPKDVAAMEAIPAAFGELVNVTAGPEPYSAVLWFEQADKTIVAVRVNIASGQIAAKSLEFTRS